MRWIGVFLAALAWAAVWGGAAPASAAAGVGAGGADAAAADPAGAFELRDGDRIAFVGNGFFERDYHSGTIEYFLTVGHPDKRITFRNLGWSGDTVWGEARAYFGEPADGYGNLLETLDEIDPTVIFVAYGANEGFAGEEGLEPFVEQYHKLLDDLEKHTHRIMLITPPPHEASNSPLPPDIVEDQNARLAAYVSAVRDIAAERGLPCLDPFDEIRTAKRRSGDRDLTINGVHLSSWGRRLAAEIILNRTGSALLLRSELDPEGEPRSELFDRIRGAIREKNELFFHRWRPANVTYLFLFRKHEQGDNAAEIPMFDPLIEEKENEIADLRAKLTSQSGRIEEKGGER